MMVALSDTHDMSTAASGASIRVENVSMQFEMPGSAPLQALVDSSLTVGSGEFCSLIGPSGCGKSTLLRLIAGLMAPTGGQVLVDGTPVREPMPGLGIVFQRDALLEWRTILDNVLLPIEIAKLKKRDYVDKARELLRIVGLEDFADYYPHRLSGGMRQRAAICRSLVNEPRLLLMDEPFGALDAFTREQINLDLLTLTQRFSTSVVFVTHSIDEAVTLSDRVLIMSARPGQVRQDLTIDLPEPRNHETKNSRDFYKEVVRVRAAFAELGVV